MTKKKKIRDERQKYFKAMISVSLLRKIYQGAEGDEKRRIVSATFNLNE